MNKEGKGWESKEEEDVRRSGGEGGGGKVVKESVARLKDRKM